MRFWLSVLCLLTFSAYSMASQSLSLPLESGEEVTVTVYPATFAQPEKPVLIWFTEGYASRKPFKQLITSLNDAGYTFWQVDLLESYFIERTPTNVRRLSGEGVAAVLNHASQQERAFVPISTGRMSLVLLRGARLWQLAHAPKQGVGQLEQLIMFFPNLFDAPKKAGDAPQLFPIVSAHQKDSDTVARIGGDEFVLVLENVANKHDVSSMIQTISQTLNEEFMVNNDKVEINCSIGVAFYPDDGTTSDSLFTTADINMYKAKGKGRHV